MRLVVLLPSAPEERSAMTSRPPSPEEPAALPRPADPCSGARIDGVSQPGWPLLTTEEHRRGAHTVLTLTGEIDLSNEHTVRAAVELCLRRAPHRLCVDLSGLTFCGVAGVHALRWALRRARAGNSEFQIVGASAWLRRLFDLAEAGDLLAVTRSAAQPVTPSVGSERARPAAEG
jgi:anti-anti-sigma factor